MAVHCFCREDFFFLINLTIKSRFLQFKHIIMSFINLQHLLFILEEFSHLKKTKIPTVTSSLKKVKRGKGTNCRAKPAWILRLNIYYYWNWVKAMQISKARSNQTALCLVLRQNYSFYNYFPSFSSPALLVPRLKRPYVRPHIRRSILCPGQND